MLSSGKVLLEAITSPFSKICKIGDNIFFEIFDNGIWNRNSHNIETLWPMKTSKASTLERKF